MKYWMMGLLTIALFGCDEATPAEANPADSGVVNVDTLPPDIGADAFTADVSMAEGTLLISPAAINFGRVTVGEQLSREFTITNSGPGPASVVQFDGLAAPFSTSRQPPLNIPVGANRTLIVTYSPEMEGRVEQILTLVTEGGARVSATIVGEAIRPTASLVSDILDLGLIPVGEPAADFIQIENTSDMATLNITGIAGIEAPFDIPQGQIPVTAAPGEVGRVLVQFQSDTDGEFEQQVSISTNAGPFMMTVRARVIAVGDIAVRGVEPAWAPTDTATTLIIHGGPFPAEPTQITVGDIELSDLARLDDNRVTGILPADAMAPTGPMDVRVELGGAFGLQAGGLIRTPPIAEGQTLDAAAIAEEVGPEGNPWTLATNEIPVGVQLIVTPDTVILGDGQTLTINGSLWTSMDVGRVVFSAAEHEPGAWGGLNFTGEASTLTNTIVEYAGTESAAIRTAQSTTFNAVTVRQSDTDGIQIDSGGLLILLGGDFTDIAGDAITLREPDGGLFRLERTWIRRVRWPVLANPNHFGSRPLGQGNDWAETEEIGIGLVGDITQDATLGNQPEGIRYSMRDTITVHQGATLTLASAAPLILSDGIVIFGQMVFPAGLALTAEENGALYIQDGGVLEIQGQMSASINLEHDDEPWTGLRVDGGSIMGRLQIQNAGKNDEAAVELAGNFGVIDHLSIQGSTAQAIRINGMGDLTNVRLSENVQGVMITGGSGRILGESTDMPAVVFAEPELCGDWDVSELLDGDEIAVETECP